MTKDLDFEMVHTDDPEELIEAGKLAILRAMKAIFGEIKKAGSPGLTWEQLDFIIEEFKLKKATIIHQEQEF